MKIDLPTENWTDLFGFVPRSQLAENVPQIGDGQFTSVAQFYLHECGQISLGRMRIMKSTNGNGPSVVYNYWNAQTRRELPLADVPLPKNIKRFQSITICYFDDSVLRFLKEFQLKSLFNTVNLDFEGCKLNTVSPLMAKLVPLFTRIERISIDANTEDVLAVLRKDYPDKVLKSARALSIRGYELGRGDDEWLHHWLKTPPSDCKPRVLVLYISYWDKVGISDFIENIRTDFMDSKKAPIRYFIELAPLYDGGVIPSLSLDNGQIKERLVIHGAESDCQHVKIMRYPIGANEQLIEEEMEAEVSKTFSGSDFATIGISTDSI